MGLCGIVIPRFWEKVQKGEGCWNWTASTAGKGYGQLKYPGTRKQLYAHRISYELHYGDIPKGLSVMHTCDNPRCVRPEHLRLGTCADNQQDMALKDRSLHGSRNGTAKLCEDQVVKVHAALKLGLTQKQVAAAFGISQIEVSRIHTGKRWRRLLPRD